MSFDWGIVGFGWVARDHMAPGLTAAGHRLVSVADPCPRARAKAEEAGAAAFPNVTALLGRPVDAVYVATPNHLHLPAVEAAAAAGIPVLCEKPMAADLGQAEAVTTAARHTLYGTAFDQRHHPAHRAIAKAIGDGAIGRVTAVRIHYACWVDPDWCPPGQEQRENWRADPQAAGGGAVMDLALHGLDLAEMLLGEPLTRLHISLQRRIHDYGVDDGGMLSGRFAGCALFQSHVAYNCPEALPRRRLEVLGERGQITAIDTMGQTAGGEVFRLCGRSGQAKPLSFDKETSPFTAQATAFAAAVRGGPHDFSATRDLRLMRLFHAAYSEARSWL